MSLKIARIKARLTQKELSEKSGVGLNTIVKIERQGTQHITMYILEKLASALNTTVAELFFSEE